MLRIRLQRMGRKKAPSYRVIVSERTKDPYAGGIEILGHYNPMAQPKILELNEERIKDWLKKGAQPSNTVHNLLINAGIISGKKKQKAVKISKKRQAKIEEARSAEEEKRREAEEAAKAEAEAKKAEAEAESSDEQTESKDDTTTEETATDDTATEESKENTEEKKNAS